MKAPIPSPTVTAPPEINPDRSFFESLLPSVSAFTEDQKLEFRCEVLNTIKRLRMSQHSTQFIPQCNVRQQERYTGYAATISTYQSQPHQLTPSRQHVPRLTELRPFSFSTPHVASATLSQPSPTWSQPSPAWSGPSPTWSQTSTALSQPYTSGLITQPISPSDGSVSLDVDREEESIELYCGSG
ncbi:unnamed protein product [Phaedon cochleariae]|uniref:BESS domain-containing protein n=1 Tax=Phaedon cochleariae TaxID=80249 RepID=A0A9P0DQY4_PHACE|nr:unnamed protein product [Phaedon cochleariae]